MARHKPNRYFQGLGCVIRSEEPSNYTEPIPDKKHINLCLTCNKDDCKGCCDKVGNFYQRRKR